MPEEVSVVVEEKKGIPPLVAVPLTVRGKAREAVEQVDPVSTISIPLAASFRQLLAVPAVVIPTTFNAPPLLLFILNRCAVESA
jgi:hypothetical protein